MTRVVDLLIRKKNIMPEIMQLTNEAKEEDLCPAGDGGTFGLVND